MFDRGLDYAEVDFLAGLVEIRKHTFRPSTIISAFRKAGLIPFSPVVVCDKIVELLVLIRKERLETSKLDLG